MHLVNNVGMSEISFTIPESLRYKQTWSFLQIKLKLTHCSIHSFFRQSALESASFVGFLREHLKNSEGQLYGLKAKSLVLSG
jgi:hypothetical protein